MGTPSILQLFILFIFVFEYFTLVENIWLVSVFMNSISIRFKLQNEYYLVFIFVPKSLFIPTLIAMPWWSLLYICIYRPVQTKPSTTSAGQHSSRNSSWCHFKKMATVRLVSYCLINFIKFNKFNRLLEVYYSVFDLEIQCFCAYLLKPLMPLLWRE